ncbi:MAG: shikimate kinase [bacterium]|nr:shikimate kinase [bacterium]
MGNNIVLIGMPCSGKSYFCNKLSEKLPNFIPVDTDILIEKTAGLTISEIFEKFSEDYFRKLEHDIIKTICTGKNKIVSVGGGAFENPDNRSILLKFGTVFYLKSDLDILSIRMSENKDRPLLNTNNPVQTLNKIYEQRKDNYQKANYTVDTSSLSEDEVIRFIIGKVNEANFAC